MAKKFGQVLFTLLIAGGLFISACSPASSIEKEIENNPEPQPTAALVVPSETEEIKDEPIPAIDVSKWSVKVAGLECKLESYGDKYLGWYMADCTEQLWFPIGQTTPIEINLLDHETCTIKPIDDFKIAIQDKSLHADPVEFVQIEDAQWGCQIPYSDTADMEVVCGLGVDCEGIGEEIRVLIFGKTIRDYLKKENGGGNGFDDGTGGGSGEEGPPGWGE